MITAFSALGVAPGSIRSWNNLRSTGPRPPLLVDESPDWLITNLPRAMKERYPNVKTANLAAYTCRLLARLIHAQAQAGRHFVMYGNPLSDLWDPEYAPEFVELYLEWYISEFRWCNMGVKDPETGQGFGARAKVFSSVPLWSGAGLSERCSCSDGPGHVKGPLNVPRSQQRLMVEAWVKINSWIFARCFSCCP